MRLDVSRPLPDIAIEELIEGLRPAQRNVHCAKPCQRLPVSGNTSTRLDILGKGAIEVAELFRCLCSEHARNSIARPERNTLFEERECLPGFAAPEHQATH